MSPLPLLILALAQPHEQLSNTWLKRSPLPGGPASPALGYETTFGYDPVAKRLIRWSGHNQGGGGEQNAETWTFDPMTATWDLKEPNTSPPGVCCGQQNVFDLHQNRFLRFQSFAGSHGWHWFRENYFSNSTVWAYDLASNTWRDRRPLPAPTVAPLRCAAWDTDHQVAVVFGGEGSHEGTLVYDPYTNTWHRRKPAKQPEERSGGNMAYDAARGKHILFGSQFGEDPRTWAYDLRRNEWTDMRPAVRPPTNRNDPVMTYDPINKLVVACVRSSDKIEKDGDVSAGHLETWAYDVGANTWTEMKPHREPDGWGNRRRCMTYLTDLRLCVMESYINPTEKVKGVDREQQIWTYSLAKPNVVEAVPPPSNVRVRTEANAAVVEWDAVNDERVEGYTILRGVGGTPWEATFEPIAKVDAKTTSFRDAKVPTGGIVYYRVQAILKDKTAASPSPIVRAQPRIVEDVVVSMISAKEARLSWPKGAADVVGYHVERAPVEVFSESQIIRLKTDTPPLAEPSAGAVKAIGPFTRLTTTPLKETAFTDTSLDLTKPHTVGEDAVYRRNFGKEQIDTQGTPYRYAVFAYRVRAVNALGVESGPSAYVLTIPRSPQAVFSKEDAGKCHLKWTANPESGIAGYRIYRMDGPKRNGPGQPVHRLTETPTKELAFTDAKAGTDTKRYWIVAVDALGQEGVPSAPTWHERQFKSYYKPFIKEWHQ